MKIPLRDSGAGHRWTTGAGVAFAIVGGLVACGHEYTEVGTTRVTSAVVAPSPPVDPQEIDAIALTRCKREARCENIGAGRHFGSYEGCAAELRGEAMNKLTTYACPKGIDVVQLDKCLADIRGERCSNLIDTLDRVTACSTSSLCSR